MIPLCVILVMATPDPLLPQECLVMVPCWGGVRGWERLCFSCELLSVWSKRSAVCHGASGAVGLWCDTLWRQIVFLMCTLWFLKMHCHELQPLAPGTHHCLASVYLFIESLYKYVFFSSNSFFNMVLNLSHLAQMDRGAELLWILWKSMRKDKIMALLGKLNITVWF